MKRIIHVEPVAPQYSVITNITFEQTDAWFGHTTQDLRMDLIYPEDTAHDYPCIVWICGGAWQSIDKSAHTGGTDNSSGNNNSDGNGG